MIIALFAMLAAQQVQPDWQPFPMEGGVGYYDRNSVLDNGHYRSIDFRIDVDRDGITSYVTRFEVDCSSRRFRSRNLIAYDQDGRELLNHRIGEQEFVSPGHARPIVNAACSHPSPRPDPVAFDAPSTFARATGRVCGEAIAHRRTGDIGWLDRTMAAMGYDRAERDQVRLDCEAYESGLEAH